MKLNIWLRQFIKFGFAALGYNIIAYLIYACLIYFSCNYLIASIISFVCGVLLSYCINKTLVFNIKHHNYLLFIRYFIFYSFLLGVNLFMLHVFVYILKINLYFAQILVTLVSALVSFNIMRRMIFQ